MQGETVPFLSYFEEYEQVEEGKEFFLAGSYKGEPVYRFTQHSPYRCLCRNSSQGDALNQITGNNSTGRYPLLVWLLADGSSDNAIIEQFLWKEHSRSKDTHGIDFGRFRLPARHPPATPPAAKYSTLISGCEASISLTFFHNFHYHHHDFLLFPRYEYVRPFRKALK